MTYWPDDDEDVREIEVTLSEPGHPEALAAALMPILEPYLKAEIARQVAAEMVRRFGDDQQVH